MNKYRNTIDLHRADVLLIFVLVIVLVYSLLPMIRRTDSQGDTIHFFKIKDLQYFKELLQGYDLSIVREFLQNNIDVVMLLPFVSYQTQFGYRYIPSQNGKVAKEENGEVLHLR